MDDENPCVGICIIGEDGYCEGCGRSEDEIYGTPPAPTPIPAPTPAKTGADGKAA
ncbi:DUF1289 domain-containing protein [Azospirillum baldaniorum]|uniref:DUF1289 domain-containing protein n=1 Tax=Azospirillum baldaniorum TaxID=1064539 RepID=A0A9P1NNC3_9PROT|nr:DUF1289 domain-containing protein [Azospirillum baldaniorum]TWA80664.1 hypothetical protein FBZ85_103104 [Azospirillum brasilense]AWJ89094.1 DUF1289 domain-containing protein [Azospirillum baldaniorum]NUB09231.1 DUF1289 domain-containing protein [Azospirillum baldaniorum]TWA66236.1 hypothetical protein FBZ84_107196 [Azospirillum baldaniorum]CCC99128.1 conserved protein of unknown function [Azospirillum baldaniorum]